MTKETHAADKRTRERQTLVRQHFLAYLEAETYGQGIVV